ncbi:MAG TPA: immunoglobulin domain-containing protein, partial [Puia sp.]
MCRMLRLCLIVFAMFDGQIALAQAPGISLVTYPIQRCVGASYRIQVSIFQGDNLVFTWQNSTDSGRTWQSIVDDDHYSNSNTYRLNLNNVLASMSHTLYRCIAENADGSDTTDARILLVATAAPGQPQFIDSMTEVCLGTSHKFSVSGGFQDDSVNWVINPYGLNNPVQP